MLNNSYSIWKYRIHGHIFSKDHNVSKLSQELSFVYIFISKDRITIDLNISCKIYFLTSFTIFLLFLCKTLSGTL